MDFSTLEKRRRRAIARWRSINAGQPICTSAACRSGARQGTFSFEDQGEIVEWAVQMRRFDQADLLSTRAARGDIDANLQCNRLCRFFVAPKGRACQALLWHYPLSGSRWYIVGALRETQLASSHEQLTAGLQRQVEVPRTSSMRVPAGFVRRCHGDLHLANIVLCHGRPTLYDAIEFDEALATIDTLYDLAFLLMDLEFRNRLAANVVLNRYLWRSGDDRDLRGLAGLPLFLGLRAAIRARVTLDRAAQKPEQEQGSDLALARVYFTAALAYVQPTAPN